MAKITRWTEGNCFRVDCVWEKNSPLPHEELTLGIIFLISLRSTYAVPFCMEIFCNIVAVLVEKGDVYPACFSVGVGPLKSSLSAPWATDCVGGMVRDTGTTELQLAVEVAKYTEIVCRAGDGLGVSDGGGSMGDWFCLVDVINRTPAAIRNRTKIVRVTASDENAWLFVCI